MSTRSSNTEAIANATGRPWSQWTKALHEASAAELTHQQIARLAAALMPRGLANPQWWAQSVAVAFEQEIGRRVPGQAQDGTFQGSTTATLPTTLDGALERWVQAVSGLAEFNGQTLTADPAISSSERWRYWRASFSDGTKTQVDIGLKGEKAAVAVNVTKAGSPEMVSEWKSFWRQILARTKE